MERDWRDDRIEELEAQVGALEAQLRACDERTAELEQQVAALMKQVAELTAKLSQNSANSHLPPSTDSPEERRKRRNKNKAKNKARKRGAQKGHAGAHRELLPEEKVSKFVDLFPPECESCWELLPKVPDASAQRHQHTEIPPVEPFTTEWRRHAVTCPCCGFRTRARYDESQIPASPFGPRLMAIMALLTGVYHLSRRKGVELLSDLLGIRVSLGALSAVCGLTPFDVRDRRLPAPLKQNSRLTVPESLPVSGDPTGSQTGAIRAGDHDRKRGPIAPRKARRSARLAASESNAT